MLSPRSTGLPWASSTWMLLNFASMGSVNQIVIRSGGWARTALAAGSDRATSACARTVSGPEPAKRPSSALIITARTIGMYLLARRIFLLGVLFTDSLFSFFSLLEFLLDLRIQNQAEQSPADN